MKISVIGLGYIGLPTAATLATNHVRFDADIKYDVIGVDINQDTVDVINSGKVHIIEKGLDELVLEAINANTLRATTRPEPSEVFIIAVPTPFNSKKEPNLDYVKKATESLAPFIKKGNLIILESTVPVGATEIVAEILRVSRKDLIIPAVGMDESDSDVFIAHCPERVLPGNILQELVTNDRIIGGITKASALKAKLFYETFTSGKCLTTDAKTAELSKLVENSFRDINIAYANELSIICDRLDIDVWELIDLANHHPRVNILQPGPGVGGHCIAVDPWFIVSTCPEDARLIKTARNVNDSKPGFVLNQVKEQITKVSMDVSKSKIACFGLSFKPDIDDLRESPALSIAIEIESMGFQNLFLVEPNIPEKPNSFELDSTQLKSIDAALSESAIILILVDHREFIEIDYAKYKDVIIIDTKGIANPLKKGS